MYLPGFSKSNWETILPMRRKCGDQLLTVAPALQGNDRSRGWEEATAGGARFVLAEAEVTHLEMSQMLDFPVATVAKQRRGATQQ